MIQRDVGRVSSAIYALPRPPRWPRRPGRRACCSPAPASKPEFRPSPLRFPRPGPCCPGWGGRRRGPPRHPAGPGRPPGRREQSPPSDTRNTRLYSLPTPGAGAVLHTHFLPEVTTHHRGSGQKVSLGFETGSSKVVLKEPKLAGAS